jgi:DNA-binding NarL/FixJ family response regulator
MTRLLNLLVTGTSRTAMDSMAADLSNSGRVSLVGAILLDEAEESVSRLMPEAVLLICGERSTKAIEAVGRLSIHARLFVLGPIDRGESVHLLLAGAAGVLPGETGIAEILAMLETTEEVVCSDQVRFELFNCLRGLRAARTSGECIISTDLSFSEVCILRLVGSGLSNKEIAQHSNLSVHTVKNHVHRILKRLGVQNRLEAADYFQNISEGRSAGSPLMDRLIS